MNKFFSFFVLLLVQQIGYGQCDKKVVFTCAKAVEWKNGVRGQEMAIPVTITLDKEQFQMQLSLDGNEEKVTGTVTEVLSCNWTSFLKDGSASYLVLAAKTGEAAIAGKLEIENWRDELHIFIGDPAKTDRMQFIVSEYTVEEPAAAADQPAVPEPKKGKRGRQ